MKEERLEILKMVSEGTVSVEEAERLLAALEKGQHDEDDARTTRRTRRQEGLKHTISQAKERIERELDFKLDNVTDFLKDVGSTISTAVSEALGTPRQTSPEEDGYEQIEDFSAGITIDEGTTVVTDVDRQGFSDHGGHIFVKVDDGMTATFETAGRCSLWQKSLDDEHTQLLVLWGDGDLHMTLPLTVARLVLRTSGGDITGTLPSTISSLEARTLGGHIRLSEVQTPFTIKTMGGDIELDNLTADQDRGTVKTMGGNVTLAFTDDSSAAVNAMTMAGEITIDHDLGAVDHDKGFVRQRSYLTIGNGTARVSAETMGGSVTLRKAK